MKWNIKKGMKPITWLVSNQFDKLKSNPSYKDFDVTKAIRDGIESWNKAFGFKVFETKVASDEDSFADDSLNYFIFDGDPTYGAAFANWRTNPDTGEIRGASDYFNAGWVEAAIRLYHEGKWMFADQERRDAFSAVLFGPHGSRYRHPPPALVAQVRNMPGISSVQITFHEEREPEQHAMPPGGFRLAIVNAWNLQAALAGREILRTYFLARAA